MATALRKSITITPEENQIISDYAKKTGQSFSVTLRKCTIIYIQQAERQEMAEYIKSHCDFVCADEQEEFNSKYAKLIEENTDEGREIKIDDLV